MREPLPSINENEYISAYIKKAHKYHKLYQLWNWKEEEHSLLWLVNGYTEFFFHSNVLLLPPC